MKHLKIVEQIIIVLIFALLIPFATIGIIISNISQHSLRYELESSAQLIAQFLGDSIENYVERSQIELEEAASAFKYIPDVTNKLKYFKTIEEQTKHFQNLEVVERVLQSDDIENFKLNLYAPIDKNNFLKAQIETNMIGMFLKDKNVRERNIYVFDFKTKNLILTNVKKPMPEDVLSGLKVNDKIKAAIFGDKKNTPKAYYKINKPDWFVVVETTTKITNDTIEEARSRIILSLIIAALSVIVIVFFYVSYLYINIRQLFKAIKAIAQGNYDKKIHLIKRSFTPFEIVFLSKEFNFMANKIKASYKDLERKNRELEKLNEFRENLINATSHEFRTP
ncbi:hypothetical protein IJ670_07840, partial [bacterium]|nr:hypothetical protein [bacterium]